VVADQVNDYAALQDVDLVFDTSGKSTSSFPFVLYERDAVDLSEAILEILNKNAPESQESDQSANKDGS
jgi:hypothetical protein